MRRLCFILLIIVICYGSVFSQIVPAILPITEKELEGYSSRVIYDWEHNYSKEMDVRYQAMKNNERAFYQSLTEYTPKEYKSTLNGHWGLLDEEGNKPDIHLTYAKYSQFVNDAFDVYITQDWYLLYRSYSQSSHIYFSEEGNMYIKANYSDIPIRRLVLFESKIYFYYPDGDEWRLDGVHNGGKNAFIRIAVPTASPY
jgi:hypothetical protein